MYHFFVKQGYFEIVLHLKCINPGRMELPCERGYAFWQVCLIEEESLSSDTKRFLAK
jgi:hypothetical protein